MLITRTFALCLAFVTRFNGLLSLFNLIDRKFIFRVCSKTEAVINSTTFLDVPFQSYNPQSCPMADLNDTTFVCVC